MCVNSRLILNMIKTLGEKKNAAALVAGKNLRERETVF